MKSSLDRRSFLRLASATAAFLARKASSQTSAPASAAQSAAPQPQSASVQLPARGQHAAVKSRKNFVGIQVRGFAWVDEGVDQVLDNIQKKGEVNTVWAYTYAYGEQRLKQGSGFPDHGAPLSAANGSSRFVDDISFRLAAIRFQDRAGQATNRRTRNWNQHLTRR